MSEDARPAPDPHAAKNESDYPKFDAKQPVRWLSPAEIGRGAIGEFYGGLFSKYVDNRDLQALARTAEIYRHPQAQLFADRPTDEAKGALAIQRVDGENDDGIGTPRHADLPYVFDYVADTGDGFGATYAIAKLMAGAEARPVPATASDPPRCLLKNYPRGELLIMGGDQVYPVANENDYDDRTVGPYLYAYRHLRDDQKIPVYAIPGNHDWYDGLVAFRQIFTNDKGLYRTQSKLPSVQTRSYWAIALPHGWWIWGIDTGLSEYGRLDSAQVDYFRGVCAHMNKDDRVIVTTSEPSWIKRSRQRQTDQPVKKLDGWDNLVAFLHSMKPGLTPEQQIAESVRQAQAGAKAGWPAHVRLVISGDKHFYAHHRSPERGNASRPVLITSGGGGAYLSSTWEVEKSTELNLAPAREGHQPEPSANDTFTAEKVWPDQNQSRRLGLLGAATIPARNPMMSALFGAIYGLFTAVIVAGQIRPSFRIDEAEEPSGAVSRFEAAVGAIDNHCALPRVAGRSWGNCVGAHLSQVGRATIDSFGPLIIAIVMLSAIGLLAWAGWSSRYTSKAGRFAAVTGAALLHTILHTLALTTTVVVSVALAVNNSTPLEVSRGWVAAALGLATLLVISPIAWRRVRYGFWDMAAAGLLTIWIPYAVWCLLATRYPGSPLTLIVGAGLTAGVVGGILGMVAFVLYLVISQYGKVHLNELFVGIRSENYKQFLRIAVCREALTVYAIGYEKIIPRTVRWKDGKATVSGPDVWPDPKEIDVVNVPRDPSP